MSKRRLKRQLNLLQVVMLGTAGTIAAGIFVLTGHVAGMVGPAMVVALAGAGLLSYSVALNYCELATAFPETGGAMTYVRNAYGANLLSFLVGSLDCLSSTFFSALSAVGFAYSLQVVIPALPLVPTAIAVVVLFTILNILGVSNVGNLQIVLGGILLAGMVTYVAAGLVLPHGFRWETFAPGGQVFILNSAGANLVAMLSAVALIYNVYIGFEVIADDAEEVQDPSHTIPRGILISLTICMFVYVLVVGVTLGTISWQELAGSPTALTDAVQRFLPGGGVPLMVLTGIIATLTSINTAMLSATREAFTLSRNGDWPRFMSRLSAYRTPYAAILVIGVIICLVAAIGAVDFLSYISSSGYLFVLFWASLSLIRLRKRLPDLKRPFRVPLFPLTAYVAAGTCALIIAFTEWRALLFGASLLGVLSAAYGVSRLLAGRASAQVHSVSGVAGRIVVPVANPHTARSLVHIASILAQTRQDASLCVLTVAPSAAHRLREGAARLVENLSQRQRVLLGQMAEEAAQRNVPFYTKVRLAPSVYQGILDEAQSGADIALILMGWPGPLDARALTENPVKRALQDTRTDLAVLSDHHLGSIRRILVPIGGGPHSRLALRLAHGIAQQEDAEIVALHCLCGECDPEEIEDRMQRLREIVEEELGGVSARVATRVVQSVSVQAGILAEALRQPYDLVSVGASEEWAGQTRLFGAVDDWIADQAPCSVLLVRDHEPAAISWIRRQTKRMEHG